MSIFQIKRNTVLKILVYESFTYCKLNSATMLLSLIFIQSIYADDKDSTAFPVAPASRIITKIGHNQSTTVSISDCVKRSLVTQISDPNIRTEFFNYAQDLIEKSDSNYELQGFVKRRDELFDFADRVDGGWDIAYVILKTLSDYALNDSSKIDKNEKAKYLISYVVHAYGRHYVSHQTDTITNDLILLLEKYTNNTDVAESNDVQIYAWRVYFVACICNQKLSDKDLLKINSLLAVRSNVLESSPRTYQMLCFAKLKGDGSLDYEGRKKIFTDELFWNIMKYGSYQTGVGDYIPYINRKDLQKMTDSYRVGYGITGSSDEIKNRFKDAYAHPSAK